MVISPTVSIVVPVLNGARFLRECLDSILAQSYPASEVIVIDDGSTDQTPELIAVYGDQIQGHRHDANRGIYATANSGIALATGRYISVFHADDVYEPTIIEREVDYMEAHREVGAVFCKDVFIDAEGRETARLTLPPELRGGEPLDHATILNALLTYKNPFLRCPGAMVRSSVYAELGTYDHKRYRNTADLEMWLRISRRHRIGIIDEHLFRYRRGIGTSSERYHHLRTEPSRYFAIIDRYLEEGGAATVTRDASLAFEGHRAEDRLLIAVNQYVLGRVREARDSLELVEVRTILRTRRVQRVRLTILLAIMTALVRAPWIRFAADMLYRRWHGWSSPISRPDQHDVPSARVS